MPKIIDLFAGAGGISLGAARAGFDVASAVELDPYAISTHIKNFPGALHLTSDVSTLSGQELLSASRLKPGELAGLVGGPPCQGFSAMGRRVVADHRNTLFEHFFRLVAEIKPAFFLAENVPGILDPQYDKIRSDALSKIENSGYKILAPIKIKACDYYAPTSRTRIFFFGYKPNSFDTEIDQADFLPPKGAFYVKVEKALKGLPIRIDNRWQTEEAGWREYTLAETDYFVERITGNIPKEIGDPQSLARYFEKQQVSGCLGTKHSDEVKRRYRALKHGETDKVSRSMRLDPNGFCPTLRAGTGKEKGSYQAVRPIHYKSDRVITPREAARLQGFPDWFVFHRTKWHSFRQIGNSVSPILAEIIFQKIHDKLR